MEIETILDFLEYRRTIMKNPFVTVGGEQAKELEKFYAMRGEKFSVERLDAERDIWLFVLSEEENTLEREE